MTTVTRRNVLKGGTAFAGGMAGILATGRAPAYAQAATVHWLRWTDFVPASDQLLRSEIAKECEKALGIKLNIETINANDIQARITSAIGSSSLSVGITSATRGRPCGGRTSTWACSGCAIRGSSADRSSRRQPMDARSAGRGEIPGSACHSRSRVESVGWHRPA